MEVAVLQFISARSLPNGIRMSDSCLPKFNVGTVLIDLFLERLSGGVLVIPSLHTSVRFISEPVKLLSGLETNVDFG